ncbi:MAG TPA: SGNH/GDSL hydrolase family protein [Pantanalinema sp.]
MRQKPVVEAWAIPTALLLLASCAINPPPTETAPPREPLPLPVADEGPPRQLLRLRASFRDALSDRAIPGARLDVDGVTCATDAEGFRTAYVPLAAQRALRASGGNYLPLSWSGAIEDGAQVVFRLTPSVVRMVAFGDSLTAGAKVSEPERFVYKIPRALRRSSSGVRVDVYPRGRSGDTYRGARDRLMEDVLSVRPDVVLVAFGTNDVAATPLRDFAGTVDAVLAPLSGRCRVMVADIPYKPRWAGQWNAQAAPFNRAIAEAAARHGATLVSWSARFKDAGDRGDWDLFYHQAPYDLRAPESRAQGDLHPNGAGNDLMASACAEVLAGWLTPEASLSVGAP